MDVFRDCVTTTSTPISIQIVISFALGVLFAPWSWGLLYFLAFLVAYEAVAIYLSALDPRYWCPQIRVGVAVSSILGFIVGRILVGYEDPLEDRKRLIPKVRTLKRDLVFDPM